jgi:anti-sigma B factor antagonist
MAAAQMRIDEEKLGTVLLLKVDDRLDSATAPEFQARLLSAIESGERSIIIDLTNVDYMNSAGLKALLVAAKKLGSPSGRMVLCGLAPNVYTVFELTGFHVLFTIRPDLAAARAEFA